MRHLQNSQVTPHCKVFVLDFMFPNDQMTQFYKLDVRFENLSLPHLKSSGTYYNLLPYLTPYCPLNYSSCFYSQENRSQERE